MNLNRMELKKNCCNWFVTMALPKMGGKKWFRNLGKSKKKKSVLSTIFLEYFYNKSHVISYYQLKFEFNTDINFLIKQ